MRSFSRETNLKISLALLFAGLLVLPIFLEHLSGKSEKVLADEGQGLGKKRFGFSLEEVSRQIGIKFTHQSPLLDPEFTPILPQIASMGASVSVCDFNNDGWNDFYVTNSRYETKNALYINLKDGGFKEVAERFEGLPS